MFNKKNLRPVVFLMLVLVLATGCRGKSGGSGKGVADYEGHWFILAELDSEGEEIKFYGMVRFDVTFTPDGDLLMYAERRNYAKEIWEDREEVFPGATYVYDAQQDQVTVEGEDGEQVLFTKGTYNGAEVVEMIPLYLGDGTKTILTRTNPKPK